MNKLIYALGIAVAATLTANSKIEKEHKAKNLKIEVKTVEKQTVAPKKDSLRIVL